MFLFLIVNVYVLYFYFMMLVTVGISFYNAEKYLDSAICSVINQTFEEWVLFLLDDGSTDSSFHIAEKYLYDKRIKLISDSQNKGFVYRLNQLISMCNTKYFVRMDADDIMHYDRLKKQISFLESNPYIDVIGSSAYSIDANNEIKGILTTTSKPNSISHVLKHSCFIHPSVTGRTSWFKKNKYNKDFVRMEDMELWARTIEQSSFFNLNEPLLYYRDVGIPYLSKYLLTMRGERKLIRKIYGSKLSFSKSYRLLQCYMKTLIYIFFTSIGLQSFLVGRRSKKVELVELLKAKMSLKYSLKAHA